MAHYAADIAAFIIAHLGVLPHAGARGFERTQRWWSAPFLWIIYFIPALRTRLELLYCLKQYLLDEPPSVWRAWARPFRIRRLHIFAFWGSECILSILTHLSLGQKVVKYRYFPTPCTRYFTITMNDHHGAKCHATSCRHFVTMATGAFFVLFGYFFLHFSLKNLIYRGFSKHFPFPF